MAQRCRLILISQPQGSKGDYDRFEALGNPGWNFENLLPFFKKAETFTPPDVKLEAEGWDIDFNIAYHGTRGFVQSSFAPFVWPSTSKSFCNCLDEADRST